MTRWDLASRLSDALESALPRGCTVTIEVPGRAHPQGDKDSFKVRAVIDFQNAAGAWRKFTLGASITEMQRDPDGVIPWLAQYAKKHITKARTTGGAA